MDDVLSHNSLNISSSKICRRKLRCLSYFLGRKKRIGCLMPKNGSVENVSSSQESDLEVKPTVPKKESVSPKGTNTNVSLCCAITDSRTPVHIQKDEKSKKMETEEPNDRLPPNGISKSDVIDPTAKVKKNHRRSFSLSKSVFSSDKNIEKVEKSVNSLSTTPLGQSPESSPSPVPRSNRGKFLLSRRSVDNIAVSSCTSSPVSTRSNPLNNEVKKRKSRPASLIVVSRRSTDKNEPARTASMDSLARQSLLAAQVLHLIPTQRARERNYLCGRIAANSLLGSVELERILPQREVMIYVATWNMNGQAPPQGLNSLLLPEELHRIPDIVVVGTQETYPEKTQWEVTLQETLGPSHVLYHSSNFGTLHLAIFLRRDLIWFCSVADEATYSVRTGSAFRTKGAIAVAFYLFGTTFLFITSHLTAHQDKVKERLQDIRRIVKALELPNRITCPHKNKDNFDYTFWSGDLNFRLTRTREEIIEWVSKQTFPLEQPAQSTPGDQLTDSIVDGSILKGFVEGPLTFAPTYKYDIGSSNFDTSNKQRIPSYTDRILYKTKRIGPENAIKCLSYSSVPSVSTSDHKPVWGLYKCPIRHGIDTIPLNAGLFNREVYLEAIKRRASALDLHDSPSACSIQ